MRVGIDLEIRKLETEIDAKVCQIARKQESVDVLRRELARLYRERQTLKGALHAG